MELLRILTKKHDPCQNSDQTPDVHLATFPSCVTDDTARGVFQPVRSSSEKVTRKKGVLVFPGAGRPFNPDEEGRKMTPGKVSC